MSFVKGPGKIGNRNFSARTMKVPTVVSDSMVVDTLLQPDNGFKLLSDVSGAIPGRHQILLNTTPISNSETFLTLTGSGFAYKTVDENDETTLNVGVVGYPTLSAVLAAGNTANTALDMNQNSLQNVRNLHFYPYTSPTVNPWSIVNAGAILIPTVGGSTGVIGFGTHSSQPDGNFNFMMPVHIGKNVTTTRNSAVIGNNSTCRGQGATNNPVAVRIGNNNTYGSGTSSVMLQVGSNTVHISSGANSSFPSPQGGIYLGYACKIMMNSSVIGALSGSTSNNNQPINAFSIGYSSTVNTTSPGGLVVGSNSVAGGGACIIGRGATSATGLLTFRLGTTQNLGTSFVTAATSGGLSTYLKVTVNGVDYKIPIHLT